MRIQRYSKKQNEMGIDSLVVVKMTAWKRFCEKVSMGERSRKLKEKIKLFECTAL